LALLFIRDRLWVSTSQAWGSSKDFAWATRGGGDRGEVAPFFRGLVITWVGLWRPGGQGNVNASMSFVLLIVKSLAYFGLPSYLLHRASQSSPLTRYYLCNILYLCTVGFCSSVAFCSSLPLYLLGRRYDVNFVFARTFYPIFSRLSGLRIVVEGKEHLQVRPCVFIGTHQSMMDVFPVAACVTSAISFSMALTTQTA
jgi:hypothetical protein